MVTSLRSREKKRVIEQLLTGDHVLLHLVPQAPGVELPSHLMENLTVTLKISRHFRGALLLHNADIEAHLLFGDSYCECRVPYDAIWGVTSEYGDTTSWLEGFNDTSTSHPEKDKSSRSDNGIDSDVSSKLPQKSKSQLFSGNTTSPLDESDSATLFQTSESIGDRIEQTTQKDCGCHESESGDYISRGDSGLLTSRPVSHHEAQEIGSIVPGTRIPDESGTEGIDEEPIELLGRHEDKDIPSFPPRLQSLTRPSSEQASPSDSPSEAPEEKERADRKENSSPAKRTPSSRGRQSSKSDSANRPKLVRVK